MIYLDTSFLVPLFREEATSRRVSEFVARQHAGMLAVSKWACVEFFSVVSRDVRMGELSAAEGAGTLEEFEATVAASFIILVPNSYDFDLAQEYVAHFAAHLRAPDALHLAVARNNGMEFVATLDEGMLAAAKRLKIPARRVIR